VQASGTCGGGAPIGAVGCGELPDSLKPLEGSRDIGLAIWCARPEEVELVGLTLSEKLTPTALLRGANAHATVRHASSTGPYATVPSDAGPRVIGWRLDVKDKERVILKSADDGDARVLEKRLYP
jgi:hypothetical protein